MKNNVLPIITFLAGAAIGAVSTYILTKPKYEKELEEETQSIRESYEDYIRELKAEEKEHVTVNQEIKTESPSSSLEKKDINEYKEILKTTNYKSYFEGNENKEEEKKGRPEPTQVITPEQFADNPDYETFSLTFTGNNYLIDEDGDPIDDTISLTGMDESEIESHFGEYEEDSVYVVNHDRKAYYEILRSEDTYVE